VTETAETTDWTRMDVFELLTMYERMCVSIIIIKSISMGGGGTY
jgi:hypothetical protein